MDTQQLLWDRLQITEVVNGVAVFADLRQWEQLRALYADEVSVDYTSFVGGEPGDVQADQLVNGWQTSLSRYSATQHLIANHHMALSGDTAQAIAAVQATHWLPQPGDVEPSWTVHGYYTYALARTRQTWVIHRHQFTATMVYGNRRLLEMQGVRPEWLQNAR